MITDKTAERMEFAIRSILEGECVPFSVIWDLTIFGVPADLMPHHKVAYNEQTGAISHVTCQVKAGPMNGFGLSIYADLQTYDPILHIAPPKYELF